MWRVTLAIAEASEFPLRLMASVSSLSLSSGSSVDVASVKRSCVLISSLVSSDSRPNLLAQGECSELYLKD